jgi:deferrochelatase/peroxidase EfeB
MTGSAVEIDLRDLQSLVAGPPKASVVRHHIFGFPGTEAARNFVRDLTPMVAMGGAHAGSTPDAWANVGFTFRGLTALGVDPDVLEELDAIFEEGPDGHALGDVPGSRSDPVTWWEGRFRAEDVHCVVQVYSRSDDALDAATAAVRSTAHRGGITELIARRDGTVLEGRSLGGGTLHFGYTDGISHPDIRWNDSAGTPGQVDFRMFVLGYATPEFSSAPRVGPAADLVRGSTYAAFRWIYQDVAAFTAFLRTEGPRLFPDLTPTDAEERLAAKLMGRWRDGTPLVTSPHHPDPTQVATNAFGYSDQDPDGRACPFSAHIRVVNPRDQALDPVVDAVPSVLRRGMPYGAPLEGDEDDGVDRGILGLFLCTDLRRQLYTMTGWIQRNDFSPVYNANRRAQDALVANRALAGAVTDFVIPGEGRNGGPAVVPALPDFVHTKGTLFLLYPGRTMLQALAAAEGDQQPSGHRPAKAPT